MGFNPGFWLVTRPRSRYPNQPIALNDCHPMHVKANQVCRMMYWSKPIQLTIVEPVGLVWLRSWTPLGLGFEPGNFTAHRTWTTVLMTVDRRTMAMMTSISCIPRTIWVKEAVKQTIATREMVQTVRNTGKVPSAAYNNRRLGAMPSHLWFPQFWIRAAKKNEHNSMMLLKTHVIIIMAVTVMMNVPRLISIRMQWWSAFTVEKMIWLEFVYQFSQSWS